MMKIVSLGVLALLATACADSQLTVENQSTFALDEIELAPINQVTWGPNLLHGSALLPGQALQIQAIDCGQYDVRIVSQAGHECVVSHLDLCFDNAVWVIDQTELASCSF